MTSIAASFQFEIAIGRSRRSAAMLWLGFCAAGLLSSTIGCGDGGVKEQAAYEQALAVTAREQAILKNIATEQQRVFGEYQFLVFVGRLKSGEVSPSGELGIKWTTDEYRREVPVLLYLHDKLPLGWFGQLDRLLVNKSQLLPWFSHTAGDLYRRRIDAQFSRALIELRDRMSLQTDRVRSAEEYARLIAPDSGEK